MSSEKKIKWVPFFLIGGVILGFGLGSILVYWFKGSFPYEILAGSLMMAIILAIIEIIRQKRKNDNLPEADERVVRNIFNYLAYTSHLFLVILFIGIVVLSLLENETISLFYLWIFAFAYVLIAGVGSQIIKRS